MDSTNPGSSGVYSQSIHIDVMLKDDTEVGLNLYAMLILDYPST